jgi:biotin transport system substrate-specific component
MPVENLRMTVYASLMAAMIAMGAYIYIPIGPAPIVLQNFFVLLAGLLLGSRWGFASMGIYLLVGAMGLPVFAGAKGGIAHFVGPTGGYLIGFAAAAYLVGFISERSGGRKGADVAAVVAASLLIYAIGVPWLKAVTGMTWVKAATVGLLPFLPGDAVKGAAAVAVARAMRPVFLKTMKPAASI